MKPDSIIIIIIIIIYSFKYLMWSEFRLWSYWDIRGFSDWGEDFFPLMDTSRFPC